MCFSVAEKTSKFDVSDGRHDSGADKKPGLRLRPSAAPYRERVFTLILRATRPFPSHLLYCANIGD